MYLMKLSRSNVSVCSHIVRRFSDQKQIGPSGGQPYKEARERRAVEFNGKIYNYPYRGIWEDEFSPQLWEQLQKDNVLTPDGQLKYWKIKDPKLRRKVLQLWYQMDDGKPVYSKGYFDYYVKSLTGVFLFLTFCGLMYGCYYIVTPKSDNIFEPNNWVRWRKESHHD